MSARYLARKAATLAATLFAVLTFNFLLFHVLPGNPVRLLARAGHLDAAARAQLTKLFGLNHSLPVQYLIYLRDMVEGKLGFSYVYREPVTTVLGPAITNTVLLLGVATVVTILAGVGLGVIAGARAHSRRDSSIVVGSLVLWSLPTFWTGMILIFLCGVWFHVLPISGITTPGVTLTGIGQFIDIARHLVLPAVTLALVNIAEFALITRSSLVDVMTEDYMLTARAKGASRRAIVWRHGVRNAMLPIMTATALYMGLVLGGAIQVETVFSWPGLGLLTYNSVLQRDYPVLEAAFLIFAVGVILANFASDLIYRLLDPRVRQT
ncbi:MAG: ABC transporter permease [Streptosporangiaceae bacterium]